MVSSTKKEINFFAQTTFRNMRRKFGIKTDDRRRHVYVVGKTGMGKTVMLENMAIQDIQNGYGIGFVDPHGEAAERLLDFVPAERINDVIYLNPADLDYPIAFNIMEKVDVEHRHLVAGGLMGVFKKIWPDVWSARMEYILNNCILALLEYPGSTLLGVNRMLADVEYRKKVVEKITDPVIKAFWVQEYARYTQRYEIEATAAIQNKVGQFVSTPLIRNIIGQVKSSIDMRDFMDKEKIIIMNLSKGRIGEDNSRLLGALLITKLQLAAMSRVDMPEEERKDFFLYVDEFQNFATESFVNVLSEARKYRLALILGHQYIAQMDEEVRDAVFGNVGTIITFRIGAEDAEFLEKEFSPEFLASDLVNLGKYNIYLKLMIDGLAGRPFSAETLSPSSKPSEKSNREKIIKVSRQRYGTFRETVEEKISRWTGVMKAPEVSSPAGPVLYDTKCSSCGKDTKVVFLPDGVRPVYCKSCRNKPAPKKEEPLKKVSPSVDLNPVRKGTTLNFNKDSSSGSAGRPPLSYGAKFPIPSAAPKPAAPLPRSNPSRSFPTASFSPPSSIPQKGKEIKEKTSAISLNEAMKKEPVFFSSRKPREEREKPKRKEIKLDELKMALDDARMKTEEKPEGNLEDRKEEMEKSKNIKEGIMKPGEKIKFVP